MTCKPKKGLFDENDENDENPNLLVFTGSGAGLTKMTKTTNLTNGTLNQRGAEPCHAAPYTGSFGPDGWKRLDTRRAYCLFHVSYLECYGLRCVTCVSSAQGSLSDLQTFLARNPFKK